ncbi:MAG: hypothetical protein ACK5O2_11665 [Microthrixaceae bacterium]
MNHQSTNNRPGNNPPAETRSVDGQPTTHLGRRIHRTAAGFTHDLDLPDPTLEAPSAVAVLQRDTSGDMTTDGSSDSLTPFELVGNGDETFSRGRWRWVAPALTGAAAAAVLAVAVWPSGTADVDLTTGPAAAGQAPAPEVSPVEDVAAMTPREALESMIAATSAATSYMTDLSLTDLAGNPTTPPSDRGPDTPYVYVGRTVFNAPGIVASSMGPTGSDEFASQYFADTTTSTEYWRKASGGWWAAPRSSTAPQIEGLDHTPAGLAESIGFTDATCVARVDDTTVLVINAPSGPCPESVSMEDDLDALGDQKRLVSADEAGRISTVSSFTDELGEPGLTGMLTRTTYSNYDSAPTLTVPDPSEVEQLDSPVVGATSTFVEGSEGPTELIGGGTEGYVELTLEDGTVVTSDGSGE